MSNDHDIGATDPCIAYILTLQYSIIRTKPV